MVDRPVPEALPTGAPVVLIVDDDVTVRTLHAAALEGAGMQPIEACNGMEALALLAEHTIDVVVLDADMPVFDGHQTLGAIRSDPQTAALTVMFVTGANDVADRVRGLDAGADDYLEKPIDPIELAARVRAHLRGRETWRRMLQRRLAGRVTVARALGFVPQGIDLAGTAEAICRCLEELDIRMSSALVLFSRTDAEVLASTGMLAAEGPSARLPHVLTQHLRERSTSEGWIEQRKLQPAGAVGVPLATPGLEAAAFIPLSAGSRPLGVLVLADGRAERRGDATQCLSAGIDLAPLIAALLRPVLARDRPDEDGLASVRQRIARSAFHPVFQPIVDLTTHRTVGFEALTRFDGGDAPDRVFAEAAALGLGLDLEAATAAAAVRASARLPEDTWLSVNVSPPFLTDFDRPAEIFPNAGRQVVLELTEHDPIHDYATVLSAVAALGEDVLLSVDDAGAGYACLHHVLRLRPSFVKLDRGWVSGIDDDPARQALVAGLGDFAERTGGCLIAEGIEHAAELAVLTDLGVTLGQGWLLGRPAEVGAY